MGREPRFMMQGEQLAVIATARVMSAALMRRVGNMPSVGDLRRVRSNVMMRNRDVVMANGSGDLPVPLHLHVAPDHLVAVRARAIGAGVAGRAEVVQTDADLG